MENDRLALAIKATREAMPFLCSTCLEPYSGRHLQLSGLYEGTFKALVRDVESGAWSLDRAVSYLKKEVESLKAQSRFLVQYPPEILLPGIVGTDGLAISDNVEQCLAYAASVHQMEPPTNDRQKEELRKYYIDMGLRLFSLINLRMGAPYYQEQHVGRFRLVYVALLAYCEDNAPPDESKAIYDALEPRPSKRGYTQSDLYLIQQKRKEEARNPAKTVTGEKVFADGRKFGRGRDLPKPPAEIRATECGAVSAFFFGCAQASPLPAIAAAEATQAAMVSSAGSSILGTPETPLYQSPNNKHDSKLSGFDLSVEWLADNLAGKQLLSLFLFRPNVHADLLQDKETRQVNMAPTHLRFRFNEFETFSIDGVAYPSIEAQAVKGDKVPVVWVEFVDNDPAKGLAAELDGIKLTWTPNQAEALQSLGEALPNPIINGEISKNIYIHPVPEENGEVIYTTLEVSRNWKDYILVFPRDTGIEALYIVLNQKAGDHQYIDAPKSLPAFPNARLTRVKTGRKRWEDKKKGRIYEWDYQHGKVEAYDRTGKHLGEFDHVTGKQTKPAKSGRRTVRN